MSYNSNEDLFSQVRVAHRLLAAYYQRINHLIDEITNPTHSDLGLGFYFWEPSRFSRPLKRHKNQLTQCSWDLLPGVLTEYVFVYGELGNNQLGDWILRVDVVSDTVVEQSVSVQNPLEINTPPDKGSSVLRFYIVGPRKDASGNWYGKVKNNLSKFNDADNSEYAYEHVKCVDDDENIYAYVFQVPMELLPTEEGSASKLVKRIKDASEIVLGDTETG